MRNSFATHATWNTTAYGVSERRNRTLLDMVRSMMSLTDLPLSFWGYALETAAVTSQICNLECYTLDHHAYHIFMHFG